MTPEQKRKRLFLLQMQIKLGQQEQPSATPQDATRQRIEAAKAGALGVPQETLDRQAEIDRMGEAELVQAQTGGKLAGAAAKAVQGVPFVGEWVDEGFDALKPGSGETLRRMQGAMDTTNPKTALGAEIAGGVVGSIPLALGAVGAAMKPATMTGKVLAGGALGMGGGAAEGAASGSGRASPGERGRGAAEGAVIGGSLGVALGAVAPVAGVGIKNLAKRVKKLDVRTIAEELGVSLPAARSIKAGLVNDDLSGAMARLNVSGDDAMLADAGGATGALLDAATKTGGKALRSGREAIEKRASEAGVRLTKRLDEILGQPGGVRAAARGIAQKSSKARQAAYDRAFGLPIDYSKQGRDIEAVLTRIPPKTLRNAVSEANEALIEAGLTNQQIMAEIADDGSVSFREMPNVRQLDAIKRALGDIAQREVDDFGRPTGAGLRASRLAGDLRDATKNAVPEYGRALKLGGDKLSEDNALRIGKGLLTKRMTFEEVRDGLRGASDEAKAAARRGLRENIEETLSNVRRTITDPNTDAREAMQLVKEMSSRANMKKARLVLGTDAKALFDELERAEAALALRGVIARNSDTAIRQSIQGQVKDEATPGLLRRTLGKGGNPLDAAREITETVAGIDPRSMSDAEKRVFDEIADALVNTRGEDAKRALRVIERAMQGQPIKDAEASMVGRAAAATLAGSGYQTGEQLLTR